jgi:thiamine pyrophosphokinase
MKKSICVISGAGEYNKKDVENMNEFLLLKGVDLASQESEIFYIAADGGISLFREEGIEPDVMIGDFDSSNFADESVTCEKIKLPVEKDDTDMLAAIRLGLERGCDEFHILGGTGMRLEHTFANIQCLSFLLEQGSHGYIYGENRILTMIRNESIKVFEENHKEERKFISIFAISDVVSGVTLAGFKYPLSNATIKKDYPIGVSNELLGSSGMINVKNGELLIIF